MNRKENMLRVIKKNQPGWVPCGMESEVFLVPPIIERPLRAGKDDWGVRWDYCEEGGTFPVHQEIVITEIEQWRQQIRIPDVESYNWIDITRDWDRKPIDLAGIDRGEQLVTGALDFGVFERMYLLLGMENALMYSLTEPEIMAEIAMTISDYNVRVIRKFNSVYPLDMIRYGDDWGTQEQLVMSPRVWREIFKPAVTKIYDAIHDEGLMVFQHTCGKVEEIFADLVEMGMDIYDPCQPCNDLKMLKEKYGDRMTFCGGIDSQHVLDYPDITEEQVRAEVRMRIDQMAQGGGYIARPSHDVPYQDYVMRAMCDEIKTYGRY